MRATLAVVLVSLLALASCAKEHEVGQVRQLEQRAELLIAELEAVPERTPQEDADLQAARSQEAMLEGIRRAGERLTQQRLAEQGGAAGSDAVNGNVVALIATGMTVLQAVGVWASRRLSATDAAAKLAAMELRRDESRHRQGIAAPSESLRQQTQSAAAIAANKAVQA